MSQATDRSGMAAAHLRVARPTDDIDALLPFYRDGLGFVLLGRFQDHEGFDGAVLGYPAPRAASPSSSSDEQPLTPLGYHLEFTAKQGHRVGKAPTEDNLLVFYVPHDGDFEAAVTRLKHQGFHPVKAFNPYWDRCGCTFEDPDGYRVVLAGRESPWVRYEDQRPDNSTTSST